MRSFQAIGRFFPNLKTTVAVGTTVLYSSYTSGRLHCSFRRKLTVPFESLSYMLDLNQNQYAIWASGNAFNGLPTFHSRYFGSSPNTINIKFEPKVVSLQWVYHHVYHHVYLPNLFKVTVPLLFVSIVSVYSAYSAENIGKYYKQSL